MRTHYLLIAFSIPAVPSQAQVDTALVLEWSSYFGGAGDDRIQAMAVDPFGHIYVTGRTTGLWEMDTSVVHQDTMGGGASDAFLAKFAPHGSLLWATYFGGPAMDEGTALAIDSVDRVYLIGNTLSDSMIATADGTQTTRIGGQDMFIAEFNVSGSLVRSTYAGGPDDDGAMDAAWHEAGRLFISGWSASDTLHMAGAAPVQGPTGGVDGILAAYGADGVPIHCSFNGGPGNDTLVALSIMDSVLVCIGNSDSTNTQVTPDALQPSPAGGIDAFIIQLDTGLLVTSATYFGGAMDDLGRDIATDSGRVVICGITHSDSLYTDSTSFSRYRAGGTDAFLAVLSDSLHLQWATLLGDTADDRAHSVALDIRGAIYVAGRTASPGSIATPLAPQTILNPPWDAFVAKFDSVNTRAWGTYLGGTDVDDAERLHVIGETAVILSGWTDSVDSLAHLGHQMTFGTGITDGWAARLQQAISTGCHGLCNGGKPLDSLVVCEGDAFSLIVFGGALGIGAEWMWYADVCGDPMYFIGSGDTLTYVPTGDMEVCVRAESALSTTTCTCIDVVLVPYPVISLTVTDTVCQGGIVELTGNGADTYHWTVAGVTLPDSPSTQFIADQAGPLSVVLEGTSGAGCTSIGTASCIVLAAPQPEWVVLPPGCPGATMGSIAMLDTSGSDLSVFWPDLGLADTVLFDLPAGIYIAEVTGTNGCVSIDTFSLTYPPGVNAAIMVSPSLCATASGSATAIPSGGSGLLFDWGAGFQSSATTDDLPPGLHSLAILDPSGCIWDTTFAIPILGAITAFTDPDTVFSSDGTADLFAGCAPVTDGATYSWTPIEPLSDPTAAITSATVSGTTLFTVVATSPEGCTDTAYAWVIVDPAAFCDAFFLPNVFSPNGDGLNDTFGAQGGCFVTFEMNIHDRWGRRVFSTTDPELPWNGTIGGSFADEGTYAVTLAADRLTGEQIAIARSITLLR